MIFRRKVYDQLLQWKERYSTHYAVLLEGPRRVGKSTIAENFAKEHYRSYIKVDFAHVTPEMLQIFDTIADLNLFFLRIQAATNIKLYEHESVLIFDEIQLQPKVRQAIKYLVADGRYSYIETGSLISIRKNVKDIVIPSEEHRIAVHPMDYEEFLWATGGDPDIIRELCSSGQAAGNALNAKLMRDFRIYMAVGGMPQAVETYIEQNNLQDVDFVIRKIMELYEEDFGKIDPSGRISMMFDDIPAQLSHNKKRFSIRSAVKTKKTRLDEERFHDLLDSRTVLPSYNVSNPEVSLSQSRDIASYKLYYADTGLFVTSIFSAYPENQDIYNKLLSDGLRANLGYLYENAAAQILFSSGRDLYYHTWRKQDSTHSYEIDFLTISGRKIVPVEIKASSVRNHESIEAFMQKYSKSVSTAYLFSQKDVSREGNIRMYPMYMMPFAIENL